MDLTFTDTLSVKGTFQQAVEDNDDWIFLIAFALLKKALAFFDVKLEKYDYFREFTCIYGL